MAQPVKISWVLRIDSQHRIAVAAVLAVLIFFLIKPWLTQAMALMVSWNVFVMVLIVMVSFLFSNAHPIEVKLYASLQDSSRTFIFLLIIAAACASVFAVFIVLGSTGHLSRVSLTRHVLLAILSVIFSWALVHVTFALRYAHLYYASKEGRIDSCEEGLIIPGEPRPDYFDFAYFSFVIGMTFQVSDIQIDSRKIRRIVLVHSLISFAFNTVIVALSINVISGLIAH